MINIKVCHFCKKTKHCPYQLNMDIEDSLQICYICDKCKLAHFQVQSPASVDLTHISTPEQLVEYITSFSSQSETISPCECGLTETEFDIKGKFGCPLCYDHFHLKMKQVVIPYHKGQSEHCGKRPKHRLFESADDKVKFLKLQLASAVEFEEFEKASEIKKQLNDLVQDQLLP